MRSSYSSPPSWNLLPPEIRNQTSLRRWNTVIILILGFVVLGAFVAGVGSNLEHKATAATGKTLQARPTVRSHHGEQKAAGANTNTHS
jgi:hypothetical protein